MIQQKVFSYKDMEVYYWTAGSPEKQAIVFLHPAFGDHTMFKHQMAHFEADYYMIAVDMVAHGKSQPHRDRVDMGCMPDIITGILDACGVKRAHLVGVSLGSLVAQATAYAHPERAASVTIVGGYSIHKDNAHIKKAQRKEMMRWVLYMLTSMDKFKAHVVSVSIKSDEGKALFTQAISSFTRKSFMYMGGMERFFVDADSPVPYPLLIMCGEHDTPLALDAAQRLNALEPGSELIIVKDAGHCANVDNPSVFNEALEAFLAKAQTK
jgi:pimeloyl-ACP methyl ester carboxylesterase